MATLADEQKAFYAAHLGYSQAVLATKSLADLQTEFTAKRFTQTPSPKATVAAGTTTGIVNPANGAYTVADQTALAARVQELVAQFNALRTALINAGLIQ